MIASEFLKMELEIIIHKEIGTDSLVLFEDDFTHGGLTFSVTWRNCFRYFYVPEVDDFDKKRFTDILKCFRETVNYILSSTNRLETSLATIAATKMPTSKPLTS